MSSLPPQSKDPNCPLNNYIFKEQCGSGAFGRVYKARRKFTGQIVAIKMIPKQRKKERELRNLRQEIEILKKLNHENIVLLLESFETKTDFCLVMEFAEGELFQILKEDKKMPEAQIQSIAIQLTKALYYLHSNRIIHRDLKPQNILIGQDNKVKLCDFGFARSMSRDTFVLNSIKGTPLYMAPEVVQEQPYNRTVDLWSLGIILYELSVGTPPFFTNNFYQLMKLIVQNDVVYPRNMSPGLKSLLQGLLQKESRNRLDWPDLLKHPYLQEKEKKEVSIINEIGRRRLKFFHRMFNEKNGSIEHLPSTSKNQSGIKQLTLDQIEKQYVSDISGMIGNQEIMLFLAQKLDVSKLKPEETEAECVKACSLVRKAIAFIQDTNTHYAGGVFENQKGLLSHVIRSIQLLVSQKYPQALLASLSVLGDALRCTLPSLQDHISFLIPRLFSLVIDLTEYSYDTKDHLVLVETLRCLKAAFVHMHTDPMSHVKLFNQLSDHDIIQSIFKGLQKWKPEAIQSHALHTLSELLHPMEGNRAFPLPCPVNRNQPSASFSGDYKHDEIRKAAGDAMIKDPNVYHVVIGWLMDVHGMRVAYQCVQYSEAFAQKFCSQADHIKAIIGVVVKNPSTSPQESQDNRIELAHLLAASIIQRNPDHILIFESQMDQLLITLLDSFCKTKNIRLKCCLSLLLARINQSQQSGVIHKLDNYFNQSGAFTVCQDILNTDFKKYEGLPRIEGYGFAERGLLDGVVFLLRDMVPLSFDRVVGCWPVVEQRCTSLFDDCELSVKGIEAAAGLAYALTNRTNQTFTSQKLLQNFLIPCIREGSIQNFARSPVGRHSISELVESIINTLFLAFTHPNANASMAAQRILHNEQCIKHVLTTLAYGQSNTIHTQIGFISRLVIKNAKFAMQFMKYCRPSLISKLLRKTNNSQMLIGMLMIISQLARLDAKNYKYIAECQIIPCIPPLLVHQDPSVRSKTCNLIGNICRHNPTFYDDFIECNVIPELVKRCHDPDCDTRKFSCFAIGNAGFHSSKLYPQLRTSIPVLIELLCDAEEKTRANAAGALGNLVRNSNELCPALIQHRAIEKLIQMLYDKKSHVARNIALFSLGNFCVHPECREVLDHHKFLDWIDDIAEYDDGMDTNTARTLQLYINRIKRKYGGQTSARSQSRAE